MSGSIWQINALFKNSSPILLHKSVFTIFILEKHLSTLAVETGVSGDTPGNLTSPPLRTSQSNGWISTSSSLYKFGIPVYLDLRVSSKTMGYPRDAPTTVLFGEWFRFEKSGDQYPHNVALTTYFRLNVSSPKTRQKDSFIRLQSSHFLRGFQQLIQKDWIDMFNEHELQLLISGSADGFDVDDLRSNTTVPLLLAIPIQQIGEENREPRQLRHLDSNYWKRYGLMEREGMVSVRWRPLGREGVQENRTERACVQRYGGVGGMAPRWSVCVCKKG
ncbi:hypothetical protein LXL04_000532 [Taraxacum kok-saghyz]